MGNSSNKNSDIFKDGCDLMVNLDSVIDFYNSDGVVTDSDKLTNLANECKEIATSLHNETQKQQEHISRLCYQELERHLNSRLTYLLRRAKQIWPTLDEYLETCHLTKDDFSWLKDWLISNIFQVRKAYDRLSKKDYIDKNNDFMGSQTLRDLWEKEADSKASIVLEISKKVLCRTDLLREVSVTLDFSHTTSHIGLHTNLIGLNAKNICGISHSKPVIKSAEFLLTLGHELGHFFNDVYSTENQNALVSSLSTFKSHSNSAIMEEIANGFSDILFEAILGNSSYFKALEPNMDKDTFIQRYKDIKLSRNYFQNLRAFTIFTLAQKTKQEFKKISDSFVNLTLDSVFLDTFIGNDTSYWMENGTPPPETLQMLRYHTDLFHKTTKDNVTSFSDLTWLTGFWTPIGYPEWIKLNKTI